MAARDSAPNPNWISARGRGAGLNPAGRFEPVHLEVLPQHAEELLVEHPDGRQVPTRVLADHSRSVINRVDVPDLPFSWTINPYRGCEHGCPYCYARPGHEFLGFSAGLDFESVILAKPDAAKIARRELAHRSWVGEPIMLSGVTDPYQPVERRLRITRSLLELFESCDQPVSLITKNRLVLRDIDLLGALARKGASRVVVSVTSLDAGLSSIMEPRASSPSARLRAIKELSEAGVPVCVMCAPIIPGINDRELPAILDAAARAGAHSASYLLIRLPGPVEPIFSDWLRREFPDRAAKVLSLIRQCRDGDVNSTVPGERFVGTGAWADQLRQTFAVFARRLGLDRELPPLDSSHFRRPSLDGQLGLWG